MGGSIKSENSSSSRIKERLTEIPIFQVDAFTSRQFGGNPAAVCPLGAFLPDPLLQAIAQENNLSETAFIVKLEAGHYHLRWFTPGVEVALCGHATLAAATIVFNHLEPARGNVRFKTLSGELTAVRKGTLFEMDFPALRPKPYEGAKDIGGAMGREPVAVLKSDAGDRDLLLVYEQAEDVANLQPDLMALKAFAPFGFIATAPANGAWAGGPAAEGTVDFVSRCFFPNHGIGEDPVTGSAHCVSAPYWADQFQKQTLYARQISARGGDLWLTLEGERLKIAGEAVEVMQGMLRIP